MDGLTANQFYGKEWEPPRISGIFERRFYLPILIYFIFMQIIGYCVKRALWRDYKPFTRYRLQNLTVSLFHSCITGSCALIFFVTYPTIMLKDTLHWYNPIAAQLTYFSIAYFFHDTMDIIKNDSSRRAREMLVHHVVTNSIFSVGMLSNKFLPYTYWALLVEVNSSFLHLRSIMRFVIRNPSNDKRYKTVSFNTFLTFLIFRFGPLLWMMNFMVVNYGKFHPFYTFSGLSAELFFFILSFVLLRRLLIEDGILTDRCSAKKRKNDVNHLPLLVQPLRRLSVESNCLQIGNIQKRDGNNLY